MFNPKNYILVIYNIWPSKPDSAACMRRGLRTCLSCRQSQCRNAGGRERWVSEWSGKPQFDTHRSTFLQRAAIWATQHQNSSVSLPLQNKSTTAFGLNRRRLDRRLGVARWPPGRVFTPRLESTLTMNSLATERNRNTLTNES